MTDNQPGNAIISRFRNKIKITEKEPSELHIADLSKAKVTMRASASFHASFTSLIISVKIETKKMQEPVYLSGVFDAKCLPESEAFDFDFSGLHKSLLTVHINAKTGNGTIDTELSNRAIPESVATLINEACNKQRNRLNLSVRSRELEIATYEQYTHADFIETEINHYKSSEPCEAKAKRKRLPRVKIIENTGCGSQ